MSERYQEISSYIPSWKGKPRTQVVEEIASYSLETRRIPDPYFFIVRDDGKLISPQTGKPVEDSVEKNSILGKVEFEALVKIQDWVVNSEEGVVVWISPPHKERSPLSKIIKSDIRHQGSLKILFNRAILLDIDGQECLKLANDIQDNIGRLISPEDLRGSPLFVTGELGDRLFDTLELATKDTDSWQMIRDGKDLMEKRIAIDKAKYIYERIVAVKIGYDSDLVKKTIENEIKIGTFGLSPVSCPPSAFEAFYINSFKVDEKFVKNCGNCGRKIGKPISKGYRCICGGVFEGC